MPARLQQLLDQLDKLKNVFGKRQAARLQSVLTSLTKRNFTDAEALIRYHEILLFVRAYPQTAHVLALAASELRSFPLRIKKLQQAEVELTALEDPEVSGIAGTEVTDTFSFYIVRWLLAHYRGQIRFDWSWFDDQNRLAETWPRFMPLLDEDASVEANVPYEEWLRAARGRVHEAAWLLQRFQSLSRTQRETAELYDSQNLFVAWRFPFRVSRTGMELPIRKVFYHRSPLIQRRDVSLKRELRVPSPPLQTLSEKQGEHILNLARATSTIRYRELYGFTHGDPARVLKTELGRGVTMFITGLPPEWRLPLRAYHAAMIFKNGIPVGYFEGLSLFERMESGFNLYYSFRDGETAWLYARTLNVFHNLLGVKKFSLDPYQIGHENEEGIESGAFWFYRKLGFRPTLPELQQLAEREEEKIASRPGYRSSPAVLRKLASGPMIYEMDEEAAGDWDQFQLRNIGFAIQRRMAAAYGGDAARARDAAAASAENVLGATASEWRERFSDFAILLDLVSDLDRWTPREKANLRKLVKAKAGTDETRYLKLMQGHRRFRAAFIKLGES